MGIRYKEQPKAKSDSYRVIVGGETFEVKLEGDTAIVNGHQYPVNITAAEEATPEKPTSNSQSSAVVSAGTPGVVTQILVGEGEQVKVGQNLCVLEVMKMETFTKAPNNGKIKKILIKKGDSVKAGDPLLELE